MKFKAPGTEPVMVALTTGHTCVVTPEGNTIEPRFRKEAIARGCSPMGVGAAEPEVQVEKTKAELIQDGIEKMLEGNDDDAFTGDGKPDAKKLSQIVGFTVTAKERDDAWAVVEKSIKSPE